MIETDAPYLLPRDIKPAPKTRRNEPGYLPYVVRAIAAARGETAEAVAAASTLTARNFFALPVTRSQATAIGLKRKCGLGLATSLSRAQPGRYFDTAISSSAAPSLREFRGHGFQHHGESRQPLGKLGALGEHDAAFDRRCPGAPP